MCWATRSPASASRSASTTASPASRASIYYRREIFKSVRRALLVGLVPLLGFAGMAFIFGKAAHDYSKAGANYSAPFLGVQVPIVIGIGGLLLGVVLMVAQWIAMPAFFRRRPETADPKILEDAPLARGT